MRHSPGCCCVNCTIFTDSFDRSDDTDIGSDWSEISGNAEIASNLLKLNTNCEVQYQWSDSETNDQYHIVKVDVRANTNGDKARIHLGNLNAGAGQDHLFAEIEFAAGAGNAKIRITRDDAGVETICRECAITAAANTWYSFWFGLNRRGSVDSNRVEAGVWFEDSFVFAWRSAYSDYSTNNYEVGLESISTNHIEFNDFQLLQTYSHSTPTNQSCEKVAYCFWPHVPNYVGEELELEIDGIALGGGTCDAASCAAINGTYTLSYNNYEASSFGNCASGGGSSRCSCWEWSGADVGCGLVYISFAVYESNTLTKPGSTSVYLNMSSSTSGAPQVIAQSQIFFNAAAGTITECNTNDWLDLLPGYLRLDNKCITEATTFRIRLKP